MSYASDKYVGMLTITHAELLDAGIYTCQVKDGEQQQCSSIEVKLAQVPDVKIIPYNVIAEKVSSARFGGDEICIYSTCRMM